jgi:hypothetical protein
MAKSLRCKSQEHFEGKGHSMAIKAIRWQREGHFEVKAPLMAKALPWQSILKAKTPFSQSLESMPEDVAAG